MCGRYVSAGDLADLSVLLGADPFAVDHSAAADGAPDEGLDDAAARRQLHEQRRFGLAPTDPVPAVLPGAGPAARRLDLLSWGLVPAWSEPSTAARRINARVETVLEKASFRRAVRARRALLPADGWYEWLRGEDGSKVPHLVQPADGGLLTFAGIYERWYPPAGERGGPLSTCAILTGPAPEPLEWLHERAPLVVPADLWSDWLDPESDAEALLEALLAVQSGTGQRSPLQVRRVSTAVNSVRNTGRRLLDPVPDDLEMQAVLW